MSPLQYDHMATWDSCKILGAGSLHAEAARSCSSEPLNTIISTTKSKQLAKVN